MATNYVQPGDVITMVAPGNVLSGELVQVGDLCGVAQSDALVGANVEVGMKGIYDLAKAAVAINFGDKVYNDSGDITNVESGKAIGVSVETVDGGAANVKVLLGVPCEALDAIAATAPTMAAVGGVGELIQTAAASRAQSSAGIAVANVVTQAANATAAGTLPVYAGATKVLSDSLVPVADLKLRVKKERITNFADANAHDLTTTLPASCIVLDAWIDLIAAGAGAVTCDFGVNGNVDGFINGAPMDAALGKQLFGAVLDGTSNWYVSTLRGDLLAVLAAGANADDRGLYQELKDASSGGKKLAYQGSIADATVVVDLYVMYVEM